MIHILYDCNDQTLSDKLSLKSRISYRLWFKYTLYH